METIIHAVAAWTIGHIEAMGYWGIALMMGIESACIPLPSEIIMPFGGYLVYSQPEKYGIWMMGIAGAFGCVLGSVLAYYVGMLGGRPLVEKFGKYILIRHKDLDKADAFFERFGDWAIFISRLLPVVRTFISFPAGVSKMPFWKFIIFTFLGSLPWCIALAWIGKVLGPKWDTLGNYFHGADVIVCAVILVLIVLYVWHHIKSDKEYMASKEAENKE